MDAIEFYRQRVSSLLETIPPILEDGRATLAVRNYALAYRRQLTVALMLWRKRDMSCMKELEKAVDISSQAATILDRNDMPWEQYDVGSAYLAAILIGREGANGRLLGQFPDPGITITTIEVSIPLLDCLLVRVLSGECDPPQLISLAKSVPGGKRLALVRATYEQYGKMLVEGKGSPQAPKLALEAARFYDRRRNDGFYSLSAEEGGGEFNREVVDFRLAVIVKVLNIEWESIHMPFWVN